MHSEEWKPISFASRAKPPAEQNYCPIESITLSIVFACKKYHQCIYSPHFIIENYHKPLKQIFSKPLIKSFPRIQRFMLALQPYHFELNNIPGRDAVVADTLSRPYIKDRNSEIPETDMETYKQTIIKKTTTIQCRTTNSIHTGKPLRVTHRHKHSSDV